MIKNHDHKKRPDRVAEPVQVYLAPEDRQRLTRLTSQLDATKSDVLRRALEALEHQLADPMAHPALGIIGIGDDMPEPGPGYDVAIEHDRFLADSEVASWSLPRKAKRGR